jgi:integrase
LTFDEAAQTVVDDYLANGRDIDGLKRRIDKHLLPFFGGRRLVGITAADVTAFIVHRQQQGIVRRGVRVADVSNAEINRELAALKRTFSLAIQGGRIASKPRIALLRESDPRSGFFEPEQLEAVLRHLPAEIRPAIEFAAITGWRVHDEVLSLEWRQIDFAEGEVRLDPGTTKNRTGRVFPFTTDLRRLLEAQHAKHLTLKKAGTIAPWVFWRLQMTSTGTVAGPIASFRKAWHVACEQAGCPGRIPHDLRRTAVRNLVRAGVPQTIAMKLTGHKTDSVFRRYDIVSPDDLRVAGDRLDAVRPASLSRR